HVIQIAVDGLGSQWIEPMLADGGERLPNLSFIQTHGASTLNARSDPATAATGSADFDLISGRMYSKEAAVKPSPWLHSLTYSSPHTGKLPEEYIASVFDVVHDYGGVTAIVSAKDAMDSGYDSAYRNGLSDGVSEGGDNGRDKIDLFGGSWLDDDSMLSVYFTNEQAHLATYSFVHFANVDVAGHDWNWGSSQWQAAVAAWDQQLGQILATIESSDELRNQTAVIITAAYGGKNRSHEDNEKYPEVYRVPVFVWGPDVPEGADLYELYAETVTDPGTRQPAWNDPALPIRTAHVANLALDLLDLPPIPGAAMTQLHRCATSSAGCDLAYTTNDRFDFGDLPASFADAAGTTDAAQLIVAGSYLGNGVSADSTSLYSTGADADDDDGVTLLSPLVPGEPAYLRITASAVGNLSAWADWNQNGAFDEPTLLGQTVVQVGENLVEIAVPADAPPGPVYFRFRYGIGRPGPFKSSICCEVEDYAFEVKAPATYDARTDHFQFETNGPFRLFVLHNDHAVMGLPLEVTTPDRGGMVSIEPSTGQLLYTPQLGFSGVESFTYSILTDEGATTTGTVVVDMRSYATTDTRLAANWTTSSGQLQLGQTVSTSLRFSAEHDQQLLEANATIAIAGIPIEIEQHELVSIPPQQLDPNSPLLFDRTVEFSRDLINATDRTLSAPFWIRPLAVGKFTFLVIPSANATDVVRLAETFEPIPYSRWDVRSLTVDVVSPEHRVELPHDVTGDGVVAPADVLAIINLLNADGVYNLADRRPVSSNQYDVNGDGWISPIDALLVINELNKPPATAVTISADRVIATGDADTVREIQPTAAADGEAEGALFQSLRGVSIAQAISNRSARLNQLSDRKRRNTA
ncbi:MAG: alkaline phosphatase family protein, partial [Planctomycetales bacterium]|nr:alkaline phosphatase family protein [Planctomycetales bacterium]